MTPQDPCTIEYKGKLYDINSWGSHQLYGDMRPFGEAGPFHIEDHGMVMDSVSSACWSGYITHYLVDNGQLFLEDVTIMGQKENKLLFGVDPTPVDEKYKNRSFDYIYRGVHQPIDYSGKLKIGSGSERIGFHYTENYDYEFLEFHELLFKRGKLIEDIDKSEENRIKRNGLKEDIYSNLASKVNYSVEDVRECVEEMNKNGKIHYWQLSEYLKKKEK